METVGNGQEALEKLKSGRFDLGLLDGEMPLMGGLETARRLRSWEADEHRGRTPLVFLTGYSEEEFGSRAREAGFDAFMTKPPGPGEIAPFNRPSGRAAFGCRIRPLAVTREIPCFLIKGFDADFPHPLVHFQPPPVQVRVEVAVVTWKIVALEAKIHILFPMAGGHAAVRILAGPGPATQAVGLGDMIQYLFEGRVLAEDGNKG